MDRKLGGLIAALLTAPAVGHAGEVIQGTHDDVATTYAIIESNLARCTKVGVINGGSNPLDGSAILSYRVGISPMATITIRPTADGSSVGVEVHGMMKGRRKEGYAGMLKAWLADRDPTHCPARL